MQKKLVKVFSLIIAVSFVLTLFAGCGSDNGGQKETSQTAGTTQAETTAAVKAYYDMYDTAQDSSDLPDWTGKQLKLKVWYAHGTTDAKRNVAEQDVVTPEIKRVTGIEIDKDTSFDNGDQEVNVKLGMLAAANDWPDIAYISEGGISSFRDLFAAGKAYDLTEALQKYAPNLAKKMPFDLFPEVKKLATNGNQDGKVYGFPVGLGFSERSLKMLKPDFVNPNPLTGIDGNAAIFIRDDILKMLYPTAKTEDEIEALYMQKGSFTKEDLFDIPVKTRDDFIKMLYDIQALVKDKKLTENGKPVEATYATTGNNWHPFSMLLPMINRLPTQVNGYTYYDRAAHSMQFTFQQDFFKDTTKLFNKMVRDGVMEKNSLLDNEAAHNEKLNNGQYAVVFGGLPDETVLKAAGKTFRYRALWMDSPNLSDQYLCPLGTVKASNVAILFKDKVAEEDVPQIVRYLDYLMSDVGEKMYGWGPRSAGLFEEKDGKRVFKDPELAEAMVYAKDNGKSLLYNLTNNRIGSLGSYGNAWPYYPTYMWGGSDLSPVYAYEKTRVAADGRNYFDPGTLPNNSVFDLAVPVGKDHHIWSYFNVESVQKFWDGRDAFEKALTATLAAKDDAQFEQVWKKFSDLAVKNGATPETLKAMTDDFVKNNEGYMDGINK